MTSAVAVRVHASWPELRAAAGAWAQEAGAMLVCPELPLFGAYSVAKNLALVRQVQGAAADGRARLLALATLERAGLEHLAACPADALAPPDTLAVKCLAAAMQPHGRAAVVCGGHMSDGAAEMATISRLIGLFADRWRRCEIFVEESRAALVKIV
jgi:hypothetical protein